MCLLGKKYPANYTEFIHSGLPGSWDPDMAGVRMRLPIPVTWETQLSAVPKSEQVTVWVQLIGEPSLPSSCKIAPISLAIKPLFCLLFSATR